MDASHTYIEYRDVHVWITIGDALKNEVEPSVLWNRRSYIVVIATLAIALAASGAPSPTYVDFQNIWGLSSLALTLAYSAYAGGVIVALLTTGGISDRIGRAPVIIASLITLAASMLIFVLASNLAFLILARFVQGIGTGVLTGAASAALTETHPSGDKKAAAAANSMTTSLSIALGAIFSGVIVDIGWGIRTPYIILLILTLVVTALVSLFSPGYKVKLEKGSGVFKIQHLSVPNRIKKKFIIASLCVTASWGVGGLYLALGGILTGSLLNLHGHLVIGLVILAVQGIGSITQFIWRKINYKVSLFKTITTAVSLLAFGVASTAVGILRVLPFIAVFGAIVSGIGFGLSFMVGTQIVSKAAPKSVAGEVLAAYFVIAYIAISIPAIGVSFMIMTVGEVLAFIIFAIAILFLCTLILIIVSIDKESYCDLDI